MTQSSRNARAFLSAVLVAARLALCALAVVGVAALAFVAQPRVAAAQSNDSAAQEKPVTPTPNKLVSTSGKVAAESATANSWSSCTCAGVGDVVSYRLEAVMPKGITALETYELWFVDSVDKGLSYVPESVRSYVEHEGAANKDVNLAKTIDGQSMRVGSDNILSDVPGIAPADKVVVEYDCIVGADAQLGLAGGNQNQLTLRYGHDASVTAESERKVVELYSFGIDVHKVGEPSSGSKDAATNLAGACFVLQNAAGEYRTASGAWSQNASDAQVVATNEDGIARFVGLNQGAYTLTETTAPSGYAQLSEPVTVELAASNVESYSRTLVATAKGASAKVEKVDASSGVATVRVEDPKSNGNGNTPNPDSNSPGNNNTPGTTTGNNATTSGSTTSRSQLATTADPLLVVSGGTLAVAAALVAVGLAKRRQSASSRDA